MYTVSTIVFLPRFLWWVKAHPMILAAPSKRTRILSIANRRDEVNAIASRQAVPGAADDWRFVGRTSPHDSVRRARTLAICRRSSVAIFDLRPTVFRLQPGGQVRLRLMYALL